MKKITLALACTVAAVSTSAMADNTIRFQGEVADQTCVVSINGNPSSPQVLLPTVPKSALAASGVTAGQTPFSIDLTGCTASASATAIKTVFVGNNLTSDGRMGNTGSATNVSLQLIDPAAPTTPLDLTGQTGAAGLNLAANATSASYNFAVEYYAEGVSTPGSVLGSVQYAVSYQ
ncbi:type 1 fimbrial protein [Citrobacter amalonaticus]|uniref:Type 1 fimbrial protein n=1 Tax=Citrobacter amalonaticus TaxID=35703 RepID=A0A2S4RS71_CITAM|nr:fimbrial protein [Citrobacter amalonaticus]POT55709.1 type 1 fimbrial protein [Citrobacter amalonaticus]POT73922.1 type 1 fimbrial protein [Citrobacter amalonaticus]POU62305.1 type 1 fimbrial protein [Citrobacter amalonaticus]POV02807.1 type 1 fimbrial protein [Citrobacter amalonaticus]